MIAKVLFLPFGLLLFILLSSCGATEPDEVEQVLGEGKVFTFEDDKEYEYAGEGFTYDFTFEVDCKKDGSNTFEIRETLPKSNKRFYPSGEGKSDTGCSAWGYQFQDKYGDVIFIQKRNMNLPYDEMGLEYKSNLETGDNFVLGRNLGISFDSLVKTKRVVPMFYELGNFKEIEEKYFNAGPK